MAKQNDDRGPDRPSVPAKDTGGAQGSPPPGTSTKTPIEGSGVAPGMANNPNPSGEITGVNDRGPPIYPGGPRTGEIQGAYPGPYTGAPPAGFASGGGYQPRYGEVTETGPGRMGRHPSGGRVRQNRPFSEFRTNPPRSVDFRDDRGGTPGMSTVDFAAPDDPTLADLVELLKKTAADARALDFMALFGDVSRLFAFGEHLWWHLATPESDTGHPPARTVSPEMDRAWSDFDSAVAEFDKAKADVVGMSPNVHLAGWYQAGGPQSGVAAPAARPSGPLGALNPTTVVKLVEAVSVVIEFVRRLRGGGLV